jgi:hypothetical protein
MLIPSSWLQLSELDNGGDTEVTDVEEVMATDMVMDMEDEVKMMRILAEEAK